MISRVQIIADIIEDWLSGQYGRDEAIQLAEECVAALDLKHPKKYETGRHVDGKDVWGCYGSIYAETEESALVVAKTRAIIPELVIVRLVEE